MPRSCYHATCSGLRSLDFVATQRALASVVVSPPFALGAAPRRLEPAHNFHINTSVTTSLVVGGNKEYGQRDPSQTVHLYFLPSNYVDTGSCYLRPTTNRAFTSQGLQNNALMITFDIVRDATYILNNRES
jgi:hypothetical protein